MQSHCLNYKVRASGPGLKLTSTVSNDCYQIDLLPNRDEVIQHWFDGNEIGQHCLSLTMHGKTQQMLGLENSDNLNVEIFDISIDDVVLDRVFADPMMFYSLFEYHHNYNGASDEIVQPFFGKMGCDGIVTMRFSSPVYLWLLDNVFEYK